MRNTRAHEHTYAHRDTAEDQPDTDTHRDANTNKITVTDKNKTTQSVIQRATLHRVQAKRRGVTRRCRTEHATTTNTGNGIIVNIRKPTPLTWQVQIGAIYVLTWGADLAVLVVALPFLWVHMRACASTYARTHIYAHTQRRHSTNAKREGADSQCPKHAVPQSHDAGALTTQRALQKETQQKVEAQPSSPLLCTTHLMEVREEQQAKLAPHVAAGSRLSASEASSACAAGTGKANLIRG